MGNAVGVFQAGEACVFSTARLSECPRKLGWCSVVEAAVRADFVVLLSPAGDFYSRVEQVREPAGAQALLAQLAIPVPPNFEIDTPNCTPTRNRLQ